VRAVPRLCVLYPGICLTTEEKARKNHTQGSRRMPVGTIKYLAKGDQWKESQLVTKTYVCDRDYSFVTGAVCLRKGLYVRDRGYIFVTGAICLRQGLYVCDKGYMFVTGLYVCDRGYMFVTRAICLWRGYMFVTGLYVCDRGYMFSPDGRGECEGTLPTLWRSAAFSWVKYDTYTATRRHIAKRK
jgi:hypothetical protein